MEPTGYRATDFVIEPDASAATYLWAAEALTGGSIDLGVPMDAFTQPDAAAAAVIAQFPHMPAVIDGSQMQDAVPTLAVLAAFNDTPVRFTGIANLRVKECDRITALSTELNRIRPGLAREDGDDLMVDGRSEATSRRSAQHGDADRDLCGSPDRHELCAGRAQDRRHHHPRSRLRRQNLSPAIGMRCADSASSSRQTVAAGGDVSSSVELFFAEHAVAAGVLGRIEAAVGALDQRRGGIALADTSQHRTRR